MSTPNTTPEIWYKTQRALRTVVQALVVLVPVVNGVAAAVIAYLTSQTDVQVHPSVFVWLNAIVAATALVMGLVASIMAVPGVNDLLTRIGLGSVPKSAVDGGSITTPGGNNIQCSSVGSRPDRKRTR